MFDPDAIYQRERRERFERMMDDATRAIGTGEGTYIRFDDFGNMIVESDADTYHASRGQALIVTDDTPATGHKRVRDRCFGIAPGSTEPTESVRVTYRDGTSEVRSVRDFRADPRPRHERMVTRDTRTESERVGGSQAQYD